MPDNPMFFDGRPQVLDKVGYTHEKLIDAIIANPRAKQKDLAKLFGYTDAWISQVVRSDAFREMYEARRQEIVDPLILQNLTDRFEFITSKALDVLEDKLDLPNVGIDAVIKSVELGARALGYGAPKSSVQINAQNFVVAMPEKSTNTASWLETHKPGRAPTVIDGRAFDGRAPDSAPAE